jgi:hypothetical protein
VAFPPDIIKAEVFKYQKQADRMIMRDVRNDRSKKKGLHYLGPPPDQTKYKKIRIHALEVPINTKKPNGPLIWGLAKKCAPYLYNIESDRSRRDKQLVQYKAAFFPSTKNMAHANIGYEEVRKDIEGLIWLLKEPRDDDLQEGNRIYRAALTFFDVLRVSLPASKSQPLADSIFKIVERASQSLEWDATNKQHKEAEKKDLSDDLINMINMWWKGKKKKPRPTEVFRAAHRICSMMKTEGEFVDKVTGKIVLVPTGAMLRNRYNDATRRARRKRRLFIEEERYQHFLWVLDG